MKHQYRYGFSWGSLAGFFLLMASITLVLLWQAIRIERPWHILGSEVPPASAMLVLIVIGGFFAVAAGVVVSVMFQQRGMSPFIILDQKSLTLPLMGAGSIEIPLAQLTAWQVVENPTRKTLWLEHASRWYRVESRLMASVAEFDALVEALRQRVGAKERLSEK